MATSPRIGFKAVRHMYGTVIPKQEAKEKATQTFVMGAPLKNNAGYVDECSTDPARILGLATKDGQNGTADGDKTQILEMAMPGVLFLGNLANAADTAVTAQTDQFKPYGILKDATSGNWFVDKDETSSKRVIIWDFWLQDKEVIGDIRGRVLFAFDPEYCEGIKV